MNLHLSHKPQIANGYCLPACLQMVLAYFRLSRSQKALARALGLTDNLGVPYSRLRQLTFPKISISIAEGTLDDVVQFIAQDIPVIAFINSGDLSYQRDDETSTSVIQHAVVIVDVDEQGVHIMDPAIEHGPIIVPELEFMLAWSLMDYEYAVLIKEDK